MLFNFVTGAFELSGTKGADEDVLPSMESLEISKAGAIKPIPSYFGGEEEEDIPDMEDYADSENLVETDPASILFLSSFASLK